MKYFLVLVSFGFFFNLAHAQNKAGCVSGTCTNGKGTYLYPSGAKYSGDWVNKLPYGRGILTSRDGNVFSGDFVKGLKVGKGKMVYANGDTYFGEYKNDIINGQGKMIYRNKDVYQGAWFDGRAHGKGNYNFADGDVFVGDFIAGEFNGIGILTRKDGSTYAGKWVKNKKHGEGIATSAVGKQSKQRYENNKLLTDLASSTVSKPNQDESPSKDCTNQYCDGIKGKYLYGDGSVFAGDFAKGDPEGLGICYYINGDRYEGGWRSHSPHGKGIMYFANGNTYAALWELGVPKEKLLNAHTKTNIQVPPKKTNIDLADTKIYAIIIGIASYNHMQSLKYTDDDAYQLFAFLKSPEGGAIPDGQIKILIDDAATKSTITAELQRFADKADANDVIMLYTSGHGLDGSFVPSDFNGYQNHLPYDDILKILNGSAAKHKLFIADACHSGSITVASRSPFNISLQNFYNAYNTVQGGTAILMSSKKEEVSLEYGGLRQGVFSHFLIRGLKGEADNNGDKLIDVSELYGYVSIQVKQYTSQAQNPQIMGDYDKNMPVAMIR